MSLGISLPNMLDQERDAFIILICKMGEIITSSLWAAIEMRGETCGQAIEGAGKNYVKTLALLYAGQVTWAKLPTA